MLTVIYESHEEKTPITSRVFELGKDNLEVLINWAVQKLKRKLAVKSTEM